MSPSCSVAAMVAVNRLFWKLCRLTSSPYTRPLPAACTNTVPRPSRPLAVALASALPEPENVAPPKSSMNAAFGVWRNALPKPQLWLDTSKLAAWP